jgi:hypothetical protein
MSFGVVLLCHTALERAAQAARFWAAGGAPVVIHVDARVPQAELSLMQAGLADLPDISFCRRRKCHWGSWSLVAATQEAAAQLIARHPGFGHVLLASGACLPLRPVADLAAYLDARPDTDFIESVTCAEADWAIGGLGMERFTLRFPFRWQTQRGLFDAWVALQWRAGLRRSLPAGLAPHLGSQWWCLTRATLEAILQDPRRPMLERFFRRVWIPDESYFQTLARSHSRRLESRSLTFSRFDDKGRPQLFFDDHAEVLRASGCFVARKIWPGAAGLYEAFLAPGPGLGAAEPGPQPLQYLFDGAARRRRTGRAGLVMQSRFPRMDHENGKTRGPYTIHQGFTDLFCDYPGWLARQVPGVVHGHLFAAGRAEFAGGGGVGPGGLRDAIGLRNYNPRGFLTSLLWSAGGVPQSFMYSPRDLPALDWFVASDPNARIAIITGAWALVLHRAGLPVAELRAEAARLHRLEAEELEMLRSPHVRAQVSVWSLAEAAMDPARVLRAVAGQAASLPALQDLTGLCRFLQDMRDAGLPLRLAGEFPPEPDAVRLAARRAG